MRLKPKLCTVTLEMTIALRKTVKIRIWSHFLLNKFRSSYKLEQGQNIFHQEFWLLQHLILLHSKCFPPLSSLLLKQKILWNPENLKINCWQVAYVFSILFPLSEWLSDHHFLSVQVVNNPLWRASVKDAYDDLFFSIGHCYLFYFTFIYASNIIKTHTFVQAGLFQVTVQKCSYKQSVQSAVY